MSHTRVPRTASGTVVSNKMNSTITVGGMHISANALRRTHEPEPAALVSAASVIAKARGGSSWNPLGRRFGRAPEDARHPRREARGDA